MNWRSLSFRDVVGIFITIIVIGLLFVAYLKLPFFKPGRWNAGSGPDWECTNPYNSGLVCLKKSPAKTGVQVTNPTGVANESGFRPSFRPSPE